MSSTENLQPQTFKWILLKVVVLPYLILIAEKNLQLRFLSKLYFFRKEYVCHIFLLLQEEDAQPSNAPDEQSYPNLMQRPLAIAPIVPGQTIHAHASDKPRRPKYPTADISPAEMAFKVQMKAHREHQRKLKVNLVNNNSNRNSGNGNSNGKDIDSGNGDKNDSNSQGGTPQNSW